MCALEDPAASPALSIDRFERGDGWAEAVVRVLDERYMRTRALPGLADRALLLLPGLVRHRCECGSAHGIAAEFADTETPHLVEHVALELAVLAGAPRTLAADTRWDFAADGRGVFRVRFKTADEELVISAVIEAARLVERLLLCEDCDDACVEEAVRRVRSRA